MLAGVGGWLLCGPAHPPEAEVDVTETPRPSAPSAPAAAPAMPPPPVQAPAPAASPFPDEQSADALPQPHPITPEHVRIQRENHLIQEMNDAMDLKDGPKLREIVGRYRTESFEDVDKLAEGYEIIANCLEHPGPASRAAAQAFWDRERGSIIRRHLHRHCLE